MGGKNTTLSIKKQIRIREESGKDLLMNSSLNPPFEMGDQAKPKRCLEY